MAFLEKLQIQGFRSFGPRDEDAQVMSLSYDVPSRKRDSAGHTVTEKRPYPLTLILGPNGCGKTTIIECLRYVTTGDHPPGSYSGRSFIHDPKMAGEVSVKAYVKLMFKGYSDTRYIIGRYMEASQSAKAKNITARTLDGTVKRISADGDQQTISMKCLDINPAVLEYLGVSKPILNYVTFCHQEESNWPLEEGSKVKAKFDEIFASDKYQNCLKNIKDIAKKHRDELRIEANSLEYLRDDKKTVATKRKELEVKKKKAEELQLEVDRAKEEMEPIKKALELIDRTMLSYSSFIQRKEKAKTITEELSKQIKEIEDELEFVIEDDLDDDKVGEMRANLETEMHVENKKQEHIRKEVKETRVKIDEDDRHRTARMGELSEFIAMRKAHLQRRDDFDDKCADFGKKLGWHEERLVTEKVSASDEAVENVLEKMKVSVANAEKRLKATNQELETRVEAKSREIHEVEKVIALNEDKRKRLVDDVAGHKREAQNISRQLREARDSQEKLQEIGDEIRTKQGELDSVSTSVNVTDLRNKIVEKKREVKELERRESELREEKMMLDANQKILADIYVKEEDAREKREKLDLLDRKSKQKFNVIFSGKAISKDLLKDVFNNESEQISSEKASLEAEIQRMKHEKETKKEKRERLKADLKNKADKVESFNERVASCGLDCEDMEDALDTVKTDIEVLREEVARVEANKYTFSEFIKRMETMKERSEAVSCPTCNRCFQTDSESAELIRDLHEEIDNIPSRVERIKSRLQVSLEKQEKLQMLLPEKRQVDEIRSDLEADKKLVKGLEQDLRGLESDLSRTEAECAKMSTRNALCEEMREKVFLIDSLHRQISDLTRKIDELRSENADLSTARNLEAFREEEASVSRKLMAARREIEAKQNKEVEVERKINVLQKELNALQQERLNIEKLSHESANLDKRKRQLEADIEKKQAEQKETDNELTSLSDQVSQLNREKNKVLAEKNKAIDACQRECNEIREMLSCLQSLAEKIRDYQHGENEAKLENRQRLVKDFTEKITKRKAALDKLERECTSIEEALARKREQIRAIDVNIKLRRLRQQRKEKVEEVRSYDKHMRELNYETEQRKKEDLEKQYQIKNLQRSQHQGRVVEMKESIRSLERDLNEPRFRDAEKKYQQQRVQYRVRQHVVQDLEKYHKALSHAISKFHHHKMSQINKAIRDLWKSTYRGNDIDYIEIKADDVDPNASMQKRKQINYRVVMVKNGVEMEMRGRCSAGQKVLASLLIRLALAETFSANCSIIALDEPTTNLDRDNIESLAEALANIVDTRSHNNKHLQLIVITHDDDLIDLLGRKVQDMEHYFKIFRNNRGLSQIRKHAFL